MRQNKIFLFLMLLLMASCYKEVPFKGLETEPELFFQCMPGAQDTTVFWLRATFPVNQDVADPEIKDPKVSFKVNGEEAEVCLNAGVSSSFPDEAFFTAVPLKPGDKLEFHAEADGFEAIESTTVVPKQLIGVSVEAKAVPSPNPDYYTAYLGRGASQGISKKVVQMKVTFQDDPDKRDFYMAEVTEYAYFHGSDGKITRYVSSVAYILPAVKTDFALEPDRVTDIILVEHESPWNTVNDFFGKSRLACVFDDSRFDGQEHTMEIMVNQMMSTSAERKYRLKLYHVSEEYYRYAKAWKIAEDASFASLPSTTAFMAYNNIEGGNGIFAGVQVYDSGIMEVQPMN